MHHTLISETIIHTKYSINKQIHTHTHTIMMSDSLKTKKNNDDDDLIFVK